MRNSPYRLGYLGFLRTLPIYYPAMDSSLPAWCMRTARRQSSEGKGRAFLRVKSMYTPTMTVVAASYPVSSFLIFVGHADRFVLDLQQSGTNGDEIACVELSLVVNVLLDDDRADAFLAKARR
jgi:hypothetical protein